MMTTNTSSDDTANDVSASDISWGKCRHYHLNLPAIGSIDSLSYAGLFLSTTLAEYINLYSTGI
jgi:hypothetical protein